MTAMTTFTRGHCRTKEISIRRASDQLEYNHSKIKRMDEMSSLLSMFLLDYTGTTSG